MSKKRKPMVLSVLRRQMKEPKEPINGAECPHCGCVESTVYRTTRKMKKIVRERVCENCGQSFLTRETVIGQPPPE